METESVIKKRPRGRPTGSGKKKDKNVKLRDIELNINVKNNFPISAIDMDKVEYTVNSDYLLKFRTTSVDAFKLLFSVIRSKFDHVYIYVDNSGIVIYHPRGESDIESFAVKIFADKFTEFNVVKNFHKCLNTIHIHDILKKFTKLKEMGMKIFEDDSSQMTCHLSIEIGMDGGITRHFDMTLPNKILTLYNRNKYSTISEVIPDYVALLNPNEFEIDMRHIKLTLGAEQVQIKCEDGKFYITAKNKEKIRYESTRLSQNGTLYIIKENDDSYNGKFDISVLYNYAKLHKMSKIVKLYLTQNKPIIIEYHINDMGAIQIFLASKV